MRNPEKTRLEIIKASAAIFNQYGYTGSSISSIMKKTGFKKGGIYNHFSGKKEIAAAAFDYSFKKVSEMIYHETEKGIDPLDKIHRMLGAFRKLAVNPPVPGGCPVTNTAMDSDDSTPELLKKSRKAMDIWQRFTENLLADAKEANLIAIGINEKEMALFIISSLEGAIMLAKMHQSAEPLNITIANLKVILQRE